MWTRIEMEQRQLNNIKEVIKMKTPNTTTIIASYLIRIQYGKQEKQPIISFKTTLLQLEKDQQTGCTLLRIYCIDKLILLIQIQIYHGFQKSYEDGGQFYAIMDSRNDFYIYYRNKKESDAMKSKIMENIPDKNEYQKIKVKRQAFRMEEQIKEMQKQAARMQETECSVFNVFDYFFGNRKNNLLEKELTLQHILLQQVKHVEEQKSNTNLLVRQSSRNALLQQPTDMERQKIGLAQSQKIKA